MRRPKSPPSPAFGRAPHGLAFSKADLLSSPFVSDEMKANLESLSAAKAAPTPTQADRKGYVHKPLVNQDEQVHSALSALKTAFNNVCRIKRLSTAQRKNLLTEFFAVALDGVADDANAPPELPKSAPLLWARRDKDRKLNPAAFTREIYGKWIGNGLKRGDLRELDRQLYQVLATWITRHPEDDIPELSRQSDIVDNLLAELSLFYEPDTLRRLGLSLQSRHQRAIENNK